MVWDDTAKKVAIRAIGVVEASMDYGAVNPVDPISIGLFQWYGTRAAELLFKIQSDNPSSFSGVASSITASMSAHSAGDAYWNNRFLTSAEIGSLKPMLRANVDIQTTMCAVDLETYRQAGESNGLSADNNTETMEFFVNMYNQGPRYALQVLGVSGGDASLNTIYRNCLNNGVLGKYASRYKQVYDIIVAQDTTGVGDPTGNPPPVNPDPPPPGGDPKNPQPTTDIVYIESRADSLYIHYKDKHVMSVAPTGHNVWTPHGDPTLGGGPTPEPDPPADPGTGTGGGDDPTSTQGKLVAWMIAHIDAYAYGQGAGRMTPDTSGYTDCSGLVYWCYKQAIGMILSGWGGAQCKQGKLITTDKSKMKSLAQPGDIIFWCWGAYIPTYDHTEMYVGDHENGDILSHGGPGNGPEWRTLSNRASIATYGMLRRYV